MINSLLDDNNSTVSKKEKYAIFRENLYDSIGRMRSNSLFWETRNTRSTGEENHDEIAVFTLKDRDIVRDDKVFYSLKRIYMEYDHVPGYEYEFALDVFDNWNYWVYLSTKSVLKENFKSWQEELDIKNKAMALRNVMEISKGNSASATLANKYLADKGWEVKAGRPSKEDKVKHLKQEQRVNESLAADMERLGLSVVGGK